MREWPVRLKNETPREGEVCHLFCVPSLLHAASIAQLLKVRATGLATGKNSNLLGMMDEIETEM